MRLSWREAIQNKRYLLGLALSCLSLIILAFFMPYFFGQVIAGKPGSVLKDFVLEQLPPSDWSWTIFILVYSATALTLITNYKDPETMLLGLATYCGVTWLRMLTIYFFTLEPPQGIIFLVDPFLSLIVYPGAFAKDLFFSGHISSMTVFVLIEPNKKLKWVKVAATIVVGILLMIQHVHYFLDVALAPLFTYLVYRWTYQIQKASAILR